MAIRTQIVSATLKKDLLKRLNTLSVESERNRSWIISKALEEYLDEIEDGQIAKDRMRQARLSSAALRKKLGV